MKPYTFFFLYTLQHVMNQIPHVLDMARVSTSKNKNNNVSCMKLIPANPLFTLVFSWSAQKCELTRDLNSCNIALIRENEGAWIKTRLFILALWLHCGTFLSCFLVCELRSLWFGRNVLAGNLLCLFVLTEFWFLTDFFFSCCTLLVSKKVSSFAGNDKNRHK